MRSESSAWVRPPFRTSCTSTGCSARRKRFRSNHAGHVQARHRVRELGPPGSALYPPLRSLRRQHGRPALPSFLAAPRAIRARRRRSMRTTCRFSRRGRASFSGPRPTCRTRRCRPSPTRFTSMPRCTRSILREFAVTRGVIRTEGRITRVQQHAESGFIESVDARKRRDRRRRPVHRLFGFPRVADRADPEDRLRRLGRLSTLRPRDRARVPQGGRSDSLHARHRQNRRLAVAHSAAVAHRQRPRLLQRIPLGRGGTREPERRSRWRAHLRAELPEVSCRHPQANRWNKNVVSLGLGRPASWSRSNRLPSISSRRPSPG